MEPGPPDRDARCFARAVRLLTEQALALEARAGAVTAGPAAARAARRAGAGWRRVAARELRPGSEACAAFAELSQVAGWLLFDAGRHPLANRFCWQARALARACGERAVEQLVLATLSMQAAHLGRPDAALRLAEAALLDAPRMPARVAAVFRVRQSRALALTGQRARALHAAGHARALFLDGPQPGDPAWTWWIDERELAGHLGLVHAGLGEWSRAVDRLEPAGAAGDLAGPTAFRALFTAELLAAQLHAGAWHDAARLAARIAPRAAAIGSGRAAGVLRRSLAPLVARPDAARPVTEAGAVPGPVREAAHWLSAGLRTPPGDAARMPTEPHEGNT
ncbi:DNA-binding protein [Streptomyces sp. TRM 70351]|uniref:DNA-binding protein n=1 Tax=Streptomyces sp. TRM 70351 TaxID=3116552 RepID=UPI002E7AFF49|nr:DNA-binding protein [Streptomyces sp. TRM 70351]MEE1927083.1 DNA-binding protein [Streptomyces sp. TRM 70351]